MESVDKKGLKNPPSVDTIPTVVWPPLNFSYFSSSQKRNMKKIKPSISALLLKKQSLINNRFIS